LDLNRCQVGFENDVDYQVLIKEFFKKVPSSAETGAKLLAEKSFASMQISPKVSP